MFAPSPPLPIPGHAKGRSVKHSVSDYEDRIRNCEANLAVKDKKIEELEDQLQECRLRTDQHENVLDDHEQYSRMCSVRIQHPEWTGMRLRTAQH